MGELVRTLKHDNGSVEVYVDQAPIDPRDEAWSVTKFVFLHRKLKLGDQHVFETPMQFSDFLRRLRTKCWFHPVYIDEQQNLTMVQPEPNVPHGVIGFIYATANMVGDFMPEIMNAPQVDIDYEIYNQMELELSAYNHFINNRVFGFLSKDSSGVVIKQQWGFYGDDFEENGLWEAAGISE